MSWQKDLKTQMIQEKFPSERKRQVNHINPTTRMIGAKGTIEVREDNSKIFTQRS